MLPTCKANNVNPQDYLLHAISQMPYCKSDQDRIKLLPRNFEGCTRQH
ncbi:MAG: transposase domain-containing protein [Flavobacteriales bacterium]|nr:transposase domain-containing protein [Flavobacteriales bacterium]